MKIFSGPASLLTSLLGRFKSREKKELSGHTHTKKRNLRSNRRRIIPIKKSEARHAAPEPRTVPSPRSKPQDKKVYRKIYLVDTENISLRDFSEKMQGQLKKKDRVYLFYTDKNARVDFATLDLLLRYTGRIYAERVKTGPNALDFQLVSVLGVMIHENPKKRFVIVSNDHGYDSVVAYWSEKGISIRRLPCEHSLVSLPGTSDHDIHYTASQEKVVDFLKSKRLSGFDIDKVEKIFRDDGTDKQLMIQQEFGSNKTRAFFARTTKADRAALARSLREAPEGTGEDHTADSLA